MVFSGKGTRAEAADATDSDQSIIGGRSTRHRNPRRDRETGERPHPYRRRDFKITNPTRVVPNVPGMSALTKHEIKRDWHEIGKKGFFVVNNDSDDDDDEAYFAKMISSRPPCLPNCTAATKRQRLEQWQTNPKQIAIDKKRIRALKSQAETQLRASEEEKFALQEFMEIFSINSTACLMACSDYANQYRRDTEDILAIAARYSRDQLNIHANSGGESLEAKSEMDCRFSPQEFFDAVENAQRELEATIAEYGQVLKQYQSQIPQSFDIPADSALFIGQYFGSKNESNANLHTSEGMLVEETNDGSSNGWASQRRRHSVGMAANEPENPTNTGAGSGVAATFRQWYQSASDALVTRASQSSSLLDMICMEEGVRDKMTTSSDDARNVQRTLSSVETLLEDYYQSLYHRKKRKSNRLIPVRGTVIDLTPRDVLLRIGAHGYRSDYCLGQVNPRVDLRKNSLSISTNLSATNRPEFDVWNESIAIRCASLLAEANFHTSVISRSMAKYSDWKERLEDSEEALLDLEESYILDADIASSTLALIDMQTNCSTEETASNIRPSRKRSREDDNLEQGGQDPDTSTDRINENEKVEISTSVSIDEPVLIATHRRSVRSSGPNSRSIPETAQAPSVTANASVRSSTRNVVVGSSSTKAVTAKRPR